MKYPYNGPYPNHAQRLRFHYYILNAQMWAFMLLVFAPYAIALFLFTRLTGHAMLAVAGLATASGVSEAPMLIGLLMLQFLSLVWLSREFSKLLESRLMHNVAEFFWNQISPPASMADEERR